MSQYVPTDVVNLSHNGGRSSLISLHLVLKAEEDYEKEWGDRDPGCPGLTTGVLHMVMFKTVKHITNHLRTLPGPQRKPSHTHVGVKPF